MKSLREAGAGDRVKGSRVVEGRVVEGRVVEGRVVEGRVIEGRVIERRVVLRDGVALGYDDTGSGDPALLLVHGWGLDRSVLRPVCDAACGARRVVSVDLRGFGASAAPAQAYSIGGYADDLAFVVAQLGLERPVVVGHSMGGMIAIDFAARYPRQLSAVVLLEAMVVAPEPVLAGLRPLLEGVRGNHYRDVAARVIRHLVGDHFEATERARLLGLVATCPQHVLVSALEGILAFDSVAAAAQVKCPLLYIGTMVRYADLNRFAQLCPQLVSGQLVGCGHYFPLEVPEQLNPMLARFLDIAVRADSSSW